MFSWDKLAKSCWMSREYVKKCAYILIYDGSIDPWLDYIVMSEMKSLSERRN